MWTIRATSVTVRHATINRFKKSRRLLLTFFAILIMMPVVVPNSTPFAQTSPAEDALIKRARAIHEKVINLDTHIDFEPANLTGERNYTQRLETQFNLPISSMVASCAVLQYLRRPDARSAESGCVHISRVRASLQTRG